METFLITLLDLEVIFFSVKKKRIFFYAFVLCIWSVVSEMFAILIKTLVGENSISKIEEGIIYPLKYEWITVIFHHLWAVPRTSK